MDKINDQQPAINVTLNSIKPPFKLKKLLSYRFSKLDQRESYHNVEGTPSTILLSKLHSSVISNEIAHGNDDANNQIISMEMKFSNTNFENAENSSLSTSNKRAPISLHVIPSSSMNKIKKYNFCNPLALSMSRQGNNSINCHYRGTIGATATSSVMFSSSMSSTGGLLLNVKKDITNKTGVEVSVNTNNLLDKSLINNRLANEDKPKKLPIPALKKPLKDETNIANKKTYKGKIPSSSPSDESERLPPGLTGIPIIDRATQLNRQTMLRLERQQQQMFKVEQQQRLALLTGVDVREEKRLQKRRMRMVFRGSAFSPVSSRHIQSKRP